MTILGSLICSCFILSGINGLYVKTGNISGVTHCNLATPTLDGNGDQFTVLLDSETAKDIPAFTKTWTGYVQDYVILQIRGCLNISDIHENSVASITNVTNPFYCATLCDKYKHFGLSVLDSKFVKCTCIQDIPTNVNKTRHGCGNACLPSRNSGIACGSQGFLSLYEKVSDNLSIEESLCYRPECDCVYYSTFRLLRFTTALYWVPCTMPNKPTCESGLMNNIVKAPWNQMNWTAAVGECFKYNYYLIPYQHSKRNNQSGYWWWTGVIRGKTIYQSQDKNMPSPSPEYGYIERDNSTFHLHFTNDTTQISRLLCNGSIQAPTTRAKSQSVSIIHTMYPERLTTLQSLSVPSTKQSNKDTSQRQSTSTVHTKPYYKISTTNLPLSSVRCTNRGCLSTGKGGSSDANRGNEQIDDPSGVYAGVSVAVVIVVVAVIGGFCFWKRRKNSDHSNHKELDDVHTGQDTEDQRISKGMINVKYNSDIGVSMLAGDGRRVTASENKPTGSTNFTVPHYSVSEKFRKDTPVPGRQTIDTGDVHQQYAVPEKVSKETAVSDKQTIDGNAVDPHYFILDKLPDTKHVPDRHTGADTEDDNYNIIADETNLDGDSDYDSIPHQNNTGKRLTADTGLKPANSDQYDKIVQLQDSGTSDDYDHIGPKTQTHNKGETQNHYDTTSALRENITDDTYDSTATRNVGNKVNGDYYDSTAEHLNGTMDDGYDTTANIRTVVSDGHYDTTSGLRDDESYDTCGTTKKAITVTSDDDYSHVQH